MVWLWEWLNRLSATSAWGHKRSSHDPPGMSHVGGRPDLNGAKADIGAGPSDAGDMPDTDPTDPVPRGYKNHPRNPPVKPKENRASQLVENRVRKTFGFCTLYWYTSPIETASPSAITLAPRGKTMKKIALYARVSTSGWSCFGLVES